MFEIIITSPPDKNKLVAEIWHNGALVVEINQETDSPRIALYNHYNNLPLADFFRAIDEAKNKLLS